MFLGKVPLPLHPVGADTDGLGPNCLELADQIAEVTALHSAAKAHGRGIEEQHDGTISEEPGQATRRTGLIGKLEISDDITLAHDRLQWKNSRGGAELSILQEIADRARATARSIGRLLARSIGNGSLVWTEAKLRVRGRITCLQIIEVCYRKNCLPLQSFPKIQLRCDRHVSINSGHH